MSRDTAQGRSHRPRVGWLAVLSLAILVVPGVVSAQGAAPSRGTTKSAAADKSTICGEVGKTIQVSSGARMYCFGSQPNSGGNKPGTITTTTSSTFSKNVNAAKPKEDISPNGTQAYGQSEVSVAGTGSYVLEAWNDSTGFFSPCPSPGYKEELTGFGFSANGGTSFTDEGGLPNNCSLGTYSGDPSVETWQYGGHTYFYVSSLYSYNATFGLAVALDACEVTGSGTSASIACNGPYFVAGVNGFQFLDKDFMSIDPVRHRLYVSYSDFTNNDSIDLAVCDISSAYTPTCYPGTTSSIYMVVSPNTTACEQEGAYPAVNDKNGDVYVAFEYNWATNLGSPCNTSATPVQEVVSYVPYSCLTLPTTTCVSATKFATVNIVSMDSAFVPGYNRFPANDFPRIAVSVPYGTVSIVWNDARNHPLGDIFLQSFHLATLTPMQSKPVRINSQSAGALHFLPALRNSDSSGLLDISFYQRADEDSALTNVYAALRVNPKTTSTPGSNYRVTDATSDWNAASSDIVPNFGDYTDNYVKATTSGSTYTSTKILVAWSDGRIGDPQPFESGSTAG